MDVVKLRKILKKHDFSKTVVIKYKGYVVDVGSVSSDDLQVILEPVKEQMED